MIRCQHFAMPADPSLLVCTVLCIEDDPDVFVLIQLILGLGSAVRVLGAARGALGLRMARERLPDLILLDVQLPDLSGESVLRRLKANPRTQRIPVIVLSADINAQLSAHLLALGAIQCLRKPFGIADLLLGVEAAADTV